MALPSDLNHSLPFTLFFGQSELPRSLLQAAGIFNIRALINMARQDIHIDTAYGELETTDNIVGKTLYEFVLLDEVEGLDNDTYCYGEIIIPRGSEKRVKNGFQAHVYVPYRAVYKLLMVRFRVGDSEELPEYMMNPASNRPWYEVVLPDGREIRLAEFRRLNSENYYNLALSDGVLALYSGHETDLLVKASLAQNETFLLKASAGNLYQHPLTGVGLIDYLHGNFENTGLAAKLQSEFESDNMVIINAYMDSATGELLLEVKEKNG